MKALTILLPLLLPLLAWSQIIRIDPDTKKVTYSEITEIEGTPQAELFDRASKWIEQQYAYAPDVTMMRHEEEGELVIYASFPVKVGFGTGTVFYQMVLAVKEEKYRYLISDFYFRAANARIAPIAFEDHRLHPQMRVFFKTDEKVQLLLASLHQKMIRRVLASAEEW